MKIKNYVILLFMVLMLITSISSIVANPETDNHILNGLTLEHEYVTSKTFNDFTTSWYHKPGLTHQEYIISIQNLQGANRVTNVTSLFSETNFNIEGISNIHFSEYKLVPYTYDVRHYKNVTEFCCNISTEFGFEAYSHNCNINQIECELDNKVWEEHTHSVFNYTEIIESEKLDFKPCKMNTFSQDNNDIKENYGNVLIPKHDSKDKGDGTLDGTKIFKLTFDTPITNINNSFGSSGRLALLLDDIEYCPYWNTTFPNRKLITITTNGTSTPAGYQVLLNISYESEMQADFDDIRFTNSAHNEIAYWNQSKVDSNYVNVWVNLSDAITDPGSDTTWMYYGNADVSSGSNIDDTFLFADDFPGSSIDTNKWNTVGTPVVSGGAVHLNADDKIAGKTNYSFGSAIEARSKADEQDVTFVGLHQAIDDDTDRYTILASDSATWGGNGNYDLITTATEKADAYDIDKHDGWGDFRNTYYIYRIMRISETETIFEQGSNTYTDDNVQVPTIDLYPYFDVWDSSQESTLDIDWVFVRNCISNEPIPSYGDEKHYTDSLHYNATSNYNHTIESDGTITANRSITAVDDTNWTAYSTGNTSWIFTTAVTPLGNTNFTLSGDDLNNFTATNLTASTEYNLVNSSGTIEQQTTDGDGVATYEVNLIAGDYWIEEEAVVSEYTPPDPVSLSNTTGNFWVNYTWSAGGGNVTDSYNVSQNGTWVNGSLTAYNNSYVGAHGHSNIIVYAYNNSGTGTLSSSFITDNVTVPNNVITISNVSASYIINEGETLYIDANYADDDSDTGVFADNSSDWNVDTATGVVSWVPADGEDGTYNWYINVTDGYESTSTQEFTVTVNNSIYDPIVTLISQSPSTIYQNSTGYMNISYGISHDTSGLNNTSVSFIYRNYDPGCNCSNHSIRPPANDLATEWDLDGRILRAANRNESLNFEDNATITGGNTYDWSGLDENSSRLTIVPVNSTYTLVYVNGTVHDIMPQSWYLDRTDMEEAPKTQLGIHKTQNVLVKLWNLEIFKGNYDYVAAGYTDTDLEDNPALHPSDADPLNYYYVSSGYDPDTDGDPLTSGYAVFMGSGNATEWLDHVYSPHANSNYVRGFINNTLVHQYINTTEISYVYFTSNTPSSKPYYINVTDVASSTNVSFADTRVLWAGDNTLTQQSYTPNMWFAFMKDGITFDHMLYVADNNDLWDNSTLSSTEVGPGLFPPTTPTFYSFHNGYVDYDMNGTYYGTIQIQIGTASDPDGGNVTHKTTLHYGNRTLITEINNVTYPPNGVYTNVSFDTTSYSTLENYTLRLVATDDENESVTVWLGVNFTINYDNFSFTNATITPSAIREGEPFTVSVDISDVDGNIIDAIVKINGGNYSMVNTAGDTWAYTFTGTSIPTRYEIDNFYAQDDFGAWNSTTSSLYIDALSSTGTGSVGGIRPVITPTPTPTPIVNVTVDEIIAPVVNISEIIERFISEEVITIVKFNFHSYIQVFEKEVYMKHANSCEFTSDVIGACSVEDEIVTVKFMYEPVGMIYTHSDSITVYGNGASQYMEVDIYVINFAHFMWWISIIVIIGAIILYRRNKE